MEIKDVGWKLEGMEAIVMTRSLSDIALYQSIAIYSYIKRHRHVSYVLFLSYFYNI